ncbi:hypothetical protein LCGC14_0571040 [marine sediment metagenome]|uniref:Uncharacterized protein n=1 Tax=marine sediment metagenome TaxID=412755 RepID=A0A0F9U5E2_9ZZZZ
MKADNIHAILFSLSIILFVYYMYIGSDNYKFALGIMIGLAIQHTINDLCANKKTKQRGKNDK